MTLTSMTGFATQEVVYAAQVWQWDIRSLNGRGLDVRCRLPEGGDNLDSVVRKLVGDRLRRGSVQVSLRRVGRDLEAEVPGADQLEHLLSQIASVQSAALRAGVTLAPVSVTDILDGRLIGGREGRISDTVAQALLPGLEAAIQALIAMRQAEGRTLTRTLSLMLKRIEDLVHKARTLEGARAKARSDLLSASLRRILAQAKEIPPERIVQELALVAMKADVTEELDRLEAHVAAARGYLAETGPVGRKFDFLTQEFNREANTLCSKAQFTELTRVGLDLKAVIDQVREQIQNVE